MDQDVIKPGNGSCGNSRGPIGGVASRDRSLARQGERNMADAMRSHGGATGGAPANQGKSRGTLALGHGTAGGLHSIR